MNINDITDIPKVAPENYLKEIFFKQEGLLEKYQSIEGIPGYPFDIDSAESQVWIKDFLWRTVEEMMEAMEAHYNADLPHTIEEVSDALHFIVEAMILAGIAPQEWDLETIVVTKQESIEQARERNDFHAACLQVCYYAGITGNTLKNKRWKQSQIQTDTHKFQLYIRETLECVLHAFTVLGCTSEEIFVYYFKKSEVNKFRQRSKY